jgi:hypothetical protein
MGMKKWGPVSAAGGETVEMSPWAIQVLIEGAHGETGETPAMNATIEAEAEETVSLLAGSEATLKAKMSTLIGQAREVQRNHASVAYGGAAPPQAQTKRATVVLDSQKTQRMQDAADTVAAALATTTDVGANLAAIAGHMTAQTMTVLAALQAEVDGKRMPSLWTPRPWATTTGQTQST